MIASNLVHQSLALTEEVSNEVETLEIKLSDAHKALKAILDYAVHNSQRANKASQARDLDTVNTVQRTASAHEASKFVAVVRKVLAENKCSVE